jgi:hypothetical protein
LEQEKWDDIFPDAGKKRAQQRDLGIAFAQKYLVFSGPTADSRARELFEHWLAGVEDQTIAPGASPQEYAYWEGRRAFVRGIQRQIKLAQEHASVVTTRTAK